MEVGGKVVGGWEPPGRRGKGCLPCRQDSWLRRAPAKLNAPPTAAQYIALLPTKTDGFVETKKNHFLPKNVIPHGSNICAHARNYGQVQNF